jgi:hypothetical protein
MKKIFTLAISLLLMSCSNEESYNPNCGTVVSVSSNINLPSHGDETYQIEILNEGGDFKIVLIPFDMSYGFPGEANQPVQKVRIGDEYCIY